jgi:hypothetical protein
MQRKTNMKRRPKCKDELDESLFGSDRTTKDGLCIYCNFCTNQLRQIGRFGIINVSHLDGLSAAKKVRRERSERQNIIRKYGEAVATIILKEGN